jgi:hypothetical protein
MTLTLITMRLESGASHRGYDCMKQKDNRDSITTYIIIQIPYGLAIERPEAHTRAMVEVSEITYLGGVNPRSLRWMV